MNILTSFARRMNSLKKSQNKNPNNFFKLRSRSGEAGLTLVELIAVILLIGVLMGVVAKNIFGNTEAAKAKANELKMNQLKGSLQNYKLQFNKYPSSLECLTKSCPETKGKLFTATTEADDLLDVWGNPYIYKTENGGRSISIQTLGADGVAGGDGANTDFVIN